MDDLISRQAAIDELVRWGAIPEYNEAEKNILACCIGMLSTLPSVQPAQKVIRCKDCKYVWKEDGWDNLYCNRVKVSGSFAVDKDGFCAWAKMEEGE